MKARITELETLLEEKDAVKPNNLSSTSLASNNSNLHPSSATTAAQLTSLKAERDQALQSSEELSSIVAELNEKNHSLQERLLTLEREQESIKLQHVLEQQAQQDEIRTLKDRAERLDRNASPSPHDDDRIVAMHERILRHKTSTSSDQLVNGKAEDSLATPRQSWSTTASGSQQLGNRAGRHESTLIQQAKQIKMLEEKIAELQAANGAGESSPTANDNNSNNNGSHGQKVPPSASTLAIGLGIMHKSSDPELTRLNSTQMIPRQSLEKISPALRPFPTFGSAVSTPPTPPPTAPLPPPPVGAVVAAKSMPAHLTGNAPPSPRIGGVFNLETASPSASPSMKPSRTGSANSRAAIAAATAGSPGGARRVDRDSTASNVSESTHNNGWASPTGSTMSVSNISAATAQALHGVEVNELKGVVDTLAHQVQALKVEQTMQQGKIHRLEAALADAEERVKQAKSERDASLAEKEQLAREVEQVRAELAAAKQKGETDRQGLESLVEKERREKEKAVETRAIMEARMEELMARKNTDKDLGPQQPRQSLQQAQQQQQQQQNPQQAAKRSSVWRIFRRSRS
ncbi:hypothetical protein BC939DRAFT_464061 [Gamsiella multidivaricata]|uniref:uncharacterized protein n=1 Tax=Gamsiella multidivaricata TaxID=101098 RepID=UPI00221F2BD1|nr:uncharacterized protein BC939DRAFT_464061 [Gamsiella multidivaricata]KAI7818011.1 hypothetical protein BC939DRAFT_464061 [Gamsiella multidivaricata]